MHQIFERWLTWLDSHDGRLHRRLRGGVETDNDIVALIPDPPGGQAIFTVGDLRKMVAQLTFAERLTTGVSSMRHPLDDLMQS